jgi:hypothetical protein
MSAGVSVGRIVRLFFESKCDCKRRLGIGDARRVAELIQFRGAFPCRRARRLNFLTSVGRANCLARFAAPYHARQNFRLAVQKRRVIGKGGPRRYPRRVGLLRGNEQAAARDVDGIY